MSWWSRFLPGRKALGRDDVLAEIAAQGASWGGQNVNAGTAFRVSTVLACARVIAEGIAQPPLKLLQEKGKERNPAREHPLYDLLASQPNPWQTSFEFREQLGLHCVLSGNYIAFKNVSSRGQVLELIPFEPRNVTVKQAEDWTLTYEVRGKSGTSKTFPAEAIWHVRGPSWNGYLGLDAVRLAREAIGLAMVTEERQARLNKHGGGVYAVEGALTAAQFKDLRDWIEKDVEPAAKAGKTRILDRGAKWQPGGQSGVDSQLLETRRQQVEEICRFLRVMPIMVGHTDKVATYASAEQMFLAHAVYTMGPWWERIEQSIDAQLLTEKERNDGYFVKFVEEGMLRGSSKDTKDVLLGYVNGGLMTPNEGRAKLDLNPDPDPASDQLRIPQNITGSVPQPDEPAPKKE